MAKKPATKKSKPAPKPAAHKEEAPKAVPKKGTARGR